MLDLTARVVVRALFGDSSDQVVQRMRAAFPPMSNAVIRRGLGAVRLPASIPTPWVRRARAARAALEVCDEIIGRRRSERTSGDEDMVGRLLASGDRGDGLGDREVRDQILIFLLAGHGTTSTALTFALHLLGRHPNIQEAVRTEALAASGSGSLTASDAHAMPLAQAVIRETMRLYPSAPVISRLAVAEHELLGHRVPAGVSVAVCVWNIHRRPDLWLDPLRFDPSRFLPENEAREQRHRALTAVTADDRIRVNGAITLFPVQAVLSTVSSRSPR